MKSIFLFCLTLLLISCSDDDAKPTTCGVLFPAAQLPWLREIIDDYREADFMDITVEQGEYNSQTVFIITECCITCDLNGFPPVYTCEGEEIAGLMPYDDTITDRRVIWKTPADKASCW